MKRANGGNGIRKKRRHMCSILKEGLEAALRADPEVLEKCKPKTAYGRLVCGIVLEAAKCKATPLKTLMLLIDWEPAEGEDEAFPDEPAWDWSPEGVWRTMPEPEPEPEPETEPVAEPADEMDGPAKRELVRRINRLIEVGQHEHAQRIIDAIRADLAAEPEPVPTG